MTKHRMTVRKALVIGVKLLIIAVVAWDIRSTLVEAFQKLDERSWHIGPGWLLLSAGFYLLGILPSAAFWHWTLRIAQQNVHWQAVVRAFYVSQVGKYAPGKALVIVMRAGMLHGPGVETTVVAATVFFETFTTMAVGSLVALSILLATYRDQLLLIGVAAGLLAAMAVPSVPKVFQFLARMLGVGKLNPTAAAKVGSIPLRDAAAGWLMIAVGWLLQGLSLWAVIRALDPPGSGSLNFLALETAAVTLSVVAGFAALIPGGIGIRELALLQLLSLAYSQDIALVSSILLRIVWLVSEVVIGIVLYAVRPRRLQDETYTVEEIEKELNV